MRTIACTLFLTLLLCTGAINAQSNTLNKQQAVSIAQQIYPGRILAVRRTDKVFKVKTLSKNGEVRIIRIDARNGRVIHGN